MGKSRLGQTSTGSFKSWHLHITNNCTLIIKWSKVPTPGTFGVMISKIRRATEETIRHPVLFCLMLLQITAVILTLDGGFSFLPSRLLNFIGTHMKCDRTQQHFIFIRQIRDHERFWVKIFFPSPKFPFLIQNSG